MNEKIKAFRLKFGEIIAGLFGMAADPYVCPPNPGGSAYIFGISHVSTGDVAPKQLSVDIDLLDPDHDQTIHSSN